MCYLHLGWTTNSFNGIPWWTPALRDNLSVISPVTRLSGRFGKVSARLPVPVTCFHHMMCPPVSSSVLNLLLRGKLLLSILPVLRKQSRTSEIRSGVAASPLWLSCRFLIFVLLTYPPCTPTTAMYGCAVGVAMGTHRGRQSLESKNGEWSGRLRRSRARQCQDHTVIAPLKAEKACCRTEKLDNTQSQLNCCTILLPVHTVCLPFLYVLYNNLGRVLYLGTTLDSNSSFQSSTNVM